MKKGIKMDHTDWVRRELKPLTESLGFRYTPRDELKDRLSRLRENMQSAGIESLLVAQKMDLYYLSGTTQDGLLFIPLEGKPLLMIKREMERARLESTLEEIVALKSIRDLPSLIRSHWGKLPPELGLPMDVL
ncbi:MAG: aminopeptidase P family N-terminal domain-containing protein, partial [Desulfobacteraceae bacterium]